MIMDALRLYQEYKRTLDDEQIKRSVEEEMRHPPRYELLTFSIDVLDVAIFGGCQTCPQTGMCELGGARGAVKS